MMRRLTVLAVAASLLAGCAVNHPQRRDIRGIERPGADPAAAAELHRQNHDLLRENYDAEWKYLGRDAPPRLGLALSGGGTRSASFSIGVLKALHEQGVLDEVDVISTVSGGSYAAYWFFSQNHYMRPELDYREQTADLFRTQAEADSNLEHPNRYRFQYTLAESSKILSYEHRPGFWQSLRNGVTFLNNLTVQGLSIPLHWLANGVFDWELNLTPYRHFYQNGLERTYGYVPRDYTLTRFANDKSLWGFKRVYAEPLSFTELQETLNKRRDAGASLPYFVINTTGAYGRLQNHFRERGDGPLGMADKVYEFTPWGCGSNLFGYRSADSCDKDLSFSRAVSISGAAVDAQTESVDIAGKSQESGTVFSAGLNLLNLDLGYQIPNRSTPWFQRDVVHKVLPWPLYWLDNVRLGRRSTSVYLSDGGHAENLGLFSLVRRGVENIIVVDAEHDSDSAFTSAKRLQRGIREHLGLELVFDQQEAIDVFAATPRQGVIEGRITGLPGPDGAPADIRLVYIKLAIDKGDLWRHASPEEGGPYPFSVVDYQRGDDRFPQNSTADIFYSPEQFVAYRDLGHAIAGRYDFGPLMERAAQARIWGGE